MKLDPERHLLRVGLAKEPNGFFVVPRKVRDAGSLVGVPAPDAGGTRSSSAAASRAGSGRTSMMKGFLHQRLDLVAVAKGPPSPDLGSQNLGIVGVESPPGLCFLELPVMVLNEMQPGAEEVPSTGIQSGNSGILGSQV